MINYGAILMLIAGISISLTLEFLTIKMSYLKGILVKPSEARWNSRATPTFGGIGIFLSTVFCASIYAYFSKSWEEIQWGILIAGAIIFCLGLIDDIRPLPPQTKLFGQFIAASALVFLGYTTKFFTPRIENDILAQIPNIVLTFIWLIGITNAINLLDNMDGLAGGISLIATIFLSFLFYRTNDWTLLPISIGLAASLIGFLLFNFPPSKIFMGDSGSLFLGFILASLAIARQPQASNVFAVMGVPVILFLLPIVDTFLVMITRVLRGDSPIQGGKDHTSHRMIAFGFSERQVVVGLYFVAAISGMVAIVLESLDYDLSLLLIPIFMIVLALFTAYLGEIKIVTPNRGVTKKSGVLAIVVQMALKRRVFEMILDFFLIGLAYYLSFWTLLGMKLSIPELEEYLDTLPLALVGVYISFFFFGVYKEVWRYVDLENLINYFKASFVGVILTGLFIIIARREVSSLQGLLILFGTFLFLGLSATRYSFRFLNNWSTKKKSIMGERIIICGTGDEGEFAFRWLMTNLENMYQIVGFIEEEAVYTGGKIHGIDILGDLSQLARLVSELDIKGIIIASNESNKHEILKIIIEVCKKSGCWIRVMKLEFQFIE